MFIQTEETPNPSTLKFIPGSPILDKGTIQFKKTEDYSQSPLAQRLFRIEGVEMVFLGQDFLSISKLDTASWTTLKPPLLAAIIEHFTLRQPVVLESVKQSPENADEDEIVLQIKELLDTRIRPAVAQDGGDIHYEKFEDGILYVTMKGACAGCPSSTATLKAGIENMMHYYVPEVLEVRQI